MPAVIREHGDEVCGWLHTKRSDEQKHLQPGLLHISFHSFFCRKSVALTWNQKRVQQQCCDQSLRLVYGAADKELLSLFSLVGSAWFFFSTVNSNPFTPRSQQLKLVSTWHLSSNSGQFCSCLCAITATSYCVNLPECERWWCWAASSCEGNWRWAWNKSHVAQVCFLLQEPSRGHLLTYF